MATVAQMKDTLNTWKAGVRRKMEEHEDTIALALQMGLSVAGGWGAGVIRGRFEDELGEWEILGMDAEILVGVGGAIGSFFVSKKLRPFMGSFFAGVLSFRAGLAGYDTGIKWAEDSDEEEDDAEASGPRALNSRRVNSYSPPPRRVAVR